MAYTPHTPPETAAMLQAIGLSTVDELFKDIPEQARFSSALDLPAALSEMELLEHMKTLGARNASTETHVCFLGAGAYDHFVPAAVEALFQRGEFLTAYTPYQAEASQGTLQWIFEFQTMICRLTGMPIANASHYDGATAVAEATGLAMELTNRSKILLVDGLHPHYRQVIETYHRPSGATLAVGSEPDEQTAAVVVQNPNFYGCLEDLAAVADAAHAKGARAIAVVNPIALTLLTAPGEAGFDVAVGESQPLGIDLQYGGPTAGFMAVSEDFVRRVPGRIVGKSVDAAGRPAYVLTLQTREQHIRREKAFSNICTNTALMALRATIHMALMGEVGLRRVAEGSVARAHELHDKITELPGVVAKIDRPFFHEFVVTLSKDPTDVNMALLEQGYVGGLDLKSGNAWLLCATEQRTPEEIDGFIRALKRIL